MSAAAWSAPSTTRACSGASCSPGGVLPIDNGELPANLQTFALTPSRINGGPGPVDPAPQLYRIEADGRRTLLELVRRDVGGVEAVSAARPEPPGTLLELEWSQACPALDQAATVPSARVRRRAQVTAARALPSTLGRLRAERREGAISVPRAGSCSELVETPYWDLGVELSSDAEPYRDQLSYTLRIDGKPAESYRDAQGGVVTWHFGGNSLGRGVDRVYRLCDVVDTYPGNLISGTHRASMVGRLPDGTELESDEVEVGYGTCEAAAADAGPSTSSNDAGSEAADPTAQASGDDGCSLRTSPRLAPLGGWAMLILGLALTSRRRRG